VQRADQKFCRQAPLALHDHSRFKISQIRERLCHTVYSNPKTALAAAAWGVLLLNCAVPDGSTIIHGGSNWRTSAKEDLKYSPSASVGQGKPMGNQAAVGDAQLLQNTMNMVLGRVLGNAKPRGYLFVREIL